MYFDLPSSLARIRIDQLIRDAATYRALYAARPRRTPLRYRIARVVRALGYAALTLGDVLAQTR